MHEVRQTDHDTYRYRPSAQGIKTLRATCLTLVLTPPALIRSMTALVALVDFPIPATSLVDLAERIAAEYGLVAETEFNGRFLNVHLLRRNS